jgi:CTP-dependent riboflavin kinase
LRPDYQTPRRMELKRQAVPLPNLEGRRVLDVGTDMGAWAWLAADAGASDVLGLDRNRTVREYGPVDLISLNRDYAALTGRDGVCRFMQTNLGKQWTEFGQFDVVLMLSMYHHVHEQCGDHRPIWFWLSRHCAFDGEVIWEGPVSDADPVVRANVSEENRKGYTLDKILQAASRYFTAERVGAALHEPTREVWRFVPTFRPRWSARGSIVSGAGGAAAAFNYRDGRRVKEIAAVLGWPPFPGSLNVLLSEPFDWESGYYRARILDVSQRGRGLDVEWLPRWARLYPLTIDGVYGCAFRFEGEGYRENFVEVIAPQRLRDTVTGPEVTATR